MTAIKSWSFSSLMMYEKCPYSARLKYIDRIPEPPPQPDSPLLRGTKFHESIERYLKDGDGLLPDLASWTPLLDQIANAHERGLVNIEGEWGFDRHWNPIPWKSATCRMKLDVGIERPDASYKVIDWKTGKATGNEVKHTMQGQLYAVGTLAQHPHLTSIQVEFHYLDFPESKPLTATYTPDKIEKFRKTYDTRANKMLTDTEFRPIPNKSNCKYCPFNTNCQYSVT